MHRVLSHALCAFFCALFCASGWAQQIVVNPAVHVSTDGPKNVYAETYAAVNPRNPLNLLATAIVSEGNMGALAVYASHDGGKSWKRGQLPPGETTANRDGDGGNADPVVSFDAEGNGLFIYERGNRSQLNVQVRRSTDGGDHWGPAVPMPGGWCDRSYFALDTGSTQHRGRIYAVMNCPTSGGVAVSYSDDGGVSFTVPVIKRFSTEFRNCFANGLVVAPDGTLVIPCQCAKGPLFDGKPQTQKIELSYVSVISTDGGRTLNDAGSIASFEGGLRKSSSAAVAAIDSSGGVFNGRVYFTWVTQTGQGADVYLSSSADLGRTWTRPVRVNDNKTPAYHVNPAVAVNNRGVVAIAWYDRRNDPKGNCHQLFVSASVDGGETFLPNVQASQPLTCPNSPGNWKIYGNTTLSKWYDFDSPDGNNVWVVDLTTPAVTFTNGGDTSGLAAGPDGVFHSAWINGPNGIMQLYSTAFSVQGKAEYEDVTERVKIELAERQFNMDDHTLSVAMRLVNTGASPLKGPLKVVWKSMRTNLDMRAANADDQQSGLGAAWMFKIGSQELQRGEKSELRDLRFVFDGKLVESAKSAERMSFRVFAPVAK